MNKFMSKICDQVNKQNKNRYIAPETKLDMMRFKKNSFSFWLCLLAIVLNVAMFLIIYKDSECTPNFQMGIDLLINVIFMLAAFSFSESTKSYNYKSGIYTIVLGVIEILRIFWIPLYYYNIYLYNFAEHEEGSLIYGLETNSFIACVILLIIAGLSLIFAGVICMEKSKKLQKHINELKKDVEVK